VPGFMWAVRALNSWLRDVLVIEEGDGMGRGRGRRGTLQKSIDFTPLLPRAGPTGGLGLACPAPTISFTIWSVAARAFDMLRVDWGVVFELRLKLDDLDREFLEL